MAGTSRMPSQNQFVGALAIFAGALLLAAVVMTQKPHWMVEDGSLDYGARRSMRSEKLAAIKPTTGKEAVALAAEAPDAGHHSSDVYFPVPGAARHPSAQSLRGRAPDSQALIRRFSGKGEDREVPLNKIRRSMYPVMNLADSKPNNEQFSKDLKAAKVKGDGKYVATVENGYNAHGNAPYQQIERSVSSGGLGGSRVPVDHEQASRWAMIGAVFIALVAIALVITYRLLPNGAWANFWDGKSSRSSAPAPQEKWDGYEAAPSSQRQMSIV